MNKVILIGVLADPPRHSKHEGRSKLWMRVRVNDEYTDAQGIVRERTSYHSVVVWGNRADALRPYLDSGRRVAIEGRLSTYKKKGAEPARYETLITVRELMLLGESAEERRAA